MNTKFSLIPALTLLILTTACSKSNGPKEATPVNASVPTVNVPVQSGSPIAEVPAVTVPVVATPVETIPLIVDELITDLANIPVTDAATSVVTEEPLDLTNMDQVNAIVAVTPVPVVYENIVYREPVQPTAEPSPAEVAEPSPAEVEPIQEVVVGPAETIIANNAEVEFSTNQLDLLKQIVDFLNQDTDNEAKLTVDKNLSKLQNEINKRLRKSLLKLALIKKMKNDNAVVALKKQLEFEVEVLEKWLIQIQSYR